MTYSQAASTYQRNAVLTASPEKLIKLLYDGAIRHLERSRVGLQDPKTSHSSEVGQSLGKAIGILGELRAALDHDAGGEVAQKLEQLYEYGLDQLSQANVSRTPQGVENTLRVLRTLKEGWDAVIPG